MHELLVYQLIGWKTVHFNFDTDWNQTSWISYMRIVYISDNFLTLFQSCQNNPSKFSFISLVFLLGGGGLLNMLPETRVAFLCHLFDAPIYSALSFHTKS